MVFWVFLDMSDEVLILEKFSINIPDTEAFSSEYYNDLTVSPETWETKNGTEQRKEVLPTCRSSFLDHVEHIVSQR